MAARLKNLDRDTPMLMPPDLRDWVRPDHIVHFIIDAVDQLPREYFQLNHRGTGDEQYPPRMMLALLIYCYATGRFSSRVIEAATEGDVFVRYICGGDLRPNHDTICTFRRKNRKLFEKAFVEVLLMAQESAGLTKAGTVSIDGTKIKANASKHSAVSHKHAGEQIELLRKEVEQLTAKAEQIDNVPLDDGLSIPDEIVRREDRIKNLERARAVIEARYEEERVRKKAEYEEKKAAYEERRKNSKPRGKEPKPPSAEPPGSKQYNFTDPESRIMKAGNGDHFEQAYNAQAAVDTETYLVVGQLVTDAPNDKQQLNPVLESIPTEVVEPGNVLADTGYYSEAAVKKAEADDGPTVYCAMSKSGHHVSVFDLEKQPLAFPPPPGAPMKEQMAHRLKTPEGKALYKQRKQTVEPVFGVIKEVLGFRRFSMRGKEKAETEWCLVCLSYNLKKVFKLMGACAPKRPAMAGK
ncbi:MAG: IS5/IS1182 family transposase [Verrucomicrobia bacterium]|nr:MAG: IS5/IS1182 family transposase [Verrucomicrobiota bacterium]